MLSFNTANCLVFGSDLIKYFAKLKMSVIPRCKRGYKSKDMSDHNSIWQKVPTITDNKEPDGFEDNVGEPIKLPPEMKEIIVNYIALAYMSEMYPSPGLVLDQTFNTKSLLLTMVTTPY